MQLLNVTAIIQMDGSHKVDSRVQHLESLLSGGFQ
ncbi:hypothetical protein BCM02_11486 [Paenibacillus methanolicus]|uniref:Uncharacterized protein n=1 Tax=Paenibacillus methanolicus TaxID=582686 RepID=A0A5S5BTU8_9BACL|nr:hypothetical protein BCM02_11486 [Paenibacillus methanolicus]